MVIRQKKLVRSLSRMLCDLFDIKPSKNVNVMWCYLFVWSVENICPLFCLIWAQYARYVLLGVRDVLCLAYLVISGAVMFLFEGQFGTILHTGDCRLTPDCVQNLPMKYITKKGNKNICWLDFVFLDCTFSKCFLKLPSKESEIRQVVLCAVVRDILSSIYLVEVLFWLHG